MQSFLDIDACIVAVEEAFVSQAEGYALESGVLGTHVDGADFTSKLRDSRPVAGISRRRSMRIFLEIVH